MKIKIGRSDKRGVNGWIKGNVLYLEGSDHWWDWLHHVLPGVAWRERRWARQVTSMLQHPDTPMVHTVAGHSLGGTVACLAAGPLRGRGWSTAIYTYGAKRPPRGGYRFAYGDKHHAIKGDIVPHLPPWRKSLPLIELDYGHLSWREAHGPAIYYEQMREDGIR
jgi:hypothetical protein